MLDEKQLKTKAWLQQIYRLDTDINALAEKIQMLDERAGSAPSVDYSRISGSKKAGAGKCYFENAVINKIDLQKQLDEEANKLYTLKVDVHENMGELSSTHQMVLRYRYIHFMFWDDIAKIMGCQTQTVLKRHREAIKELSEILTAKGVI